MARPERRTPGARRARLLVPAALAVAGLAAVVLPRGAAAQSSAALFEGYLAELARPDPHYVAVSNHFRHTDDCSRVGCAIMGPTQDRAACEAWARSWNELDPYDHARCVQIETPPLAR